MKNIAISEKDFIDFRENVLNPCLKENKSVFKTIDYSMENFNTLFPWSRIETPLESVKFGRGQFSKFSLRERRNLISAVYETLTKPDIVLQEERPGEFDEPAISHNYAKNFAMDKDSKMIQSVVVEIEDENVIITSHERPVNEIVSKIKQADQILYIAPEIGSLIRQKVQNEQSVSHQFLGETLQNRTSSLNKSYRYSEEKSIENLLSEGKLTNKDVLRYGEPVGIKAVQRVNYILRKDNKPELDENTFKDSTLEELMKCIGDSYGYPEEATNKRKHIAFQTLNRAKVVFEKYSEYITRKIAQKKEIVYENRIEEIGKSENDRKEYLNLFENEMNKSERRRIDRISKELASSIHNIRENETEDSSCSMNFDSSILGMKADETKEYRLNVSFDGEKIKNYSIDCIHIENGILSDIDYDIHNDFDEKQSKLFEAVKTGISEKIKDYEQKKDISEKTVKKAELDDKSVEQLWKELEDVPFKENENGKLVLDSSEKWNGFEPGTSRERIWNWFDKHHSKGISYLVNDYDAENFEKRYAAKNNVRNFIKEKLSVSDEGSQQRKEYEYVVHLQESKKWDLIEKNYPDYETSKAITLSNDIAMWEEGQNDDFRTVEQFNERESSFFKSREEILEFGNKLDEQLYKTAYAYMNHMETDELEVSESMAEKIHEEQKEITVTHSVTFPCGFTFPEEIENDYGKKEEYRWKVFEELKSKYGFNENDAETEYFDDKVSPKNDSFNISFAAPVPNDIKKSKEMVENWIKNIEKDLTENYGAFINWQGGERLEEKYNSMEEFEMKREEKPVTENEKTQKVIARIDNAFEIAKQTVYVKQPFNGKRYSAAEKGIYILEAVKHFSENAPESLNKDFEILLKGKDSVENGIDSLGFVRPDSEQMKIGMENGWDFEDVCKGYVIAESDELPKGVKVIQRIDDMSAFESDEAASVQAQADGIKIIPSYKLSFSDDDPMSYYSYVDSLENRELLKDYILSEEEMALNIEIEWFKDRTESEFSLPEQLKDSAQKFDEENLKKWNNPDQPYSVLLTDDMTGNHLLIDVLASGYSTNLFDKTGKFIENDNFSSYKGNSGDDIDITSSIEAGIVSMHEYQNHNLWGDFHKFHVNKDEGLKENLIMVEADFALYDEKMSRQTKEYSEPMRLGHILGESFFTTDFKPEVWSYLLEKGADMDEALKTAAADANLGDNLKWLIENAPEKQWERIKNNSSFCKEVMDTAEKSITNDEEFSVEPMLSLAEKLGMEAEGIRYCNSLIKEYGGKYDLSALKDSLNRFTQKDAGRVKAKIAEITSMSFEAAADSKNVDEKTLAKEFAELLNEKDRIEHPDKEEYKHFTADFILCELEKGSSYGQIMAAVHPGVSFFDDKEKMKDFQNMSEKEFLKSYSYLSKSDYQVTKSVLEKNVYAVYSDIYNALSDAEKSVYTGKELKDLGIAVRFICNISADSKFSADTLRNEFPEIWKDTDVLRIQSDFNADGIMQQPVYLIHFDKDMKEVSSLKMDSLSSITNVQLKRNLRDHFSRFVNKNYDMSVREAFDLEPKPGKVFTTDDAKDFAEILNSYRNSSSEPEISEEMAGCIIEYLEYEDYRVYLEKEKGNLCLYDNSEDYTGHGEIQTVKDIVEFAMEMAYKAKDLEYDVYSPESFEKIRQLNDAYNASALSAKLSDKLLYATSDDERQAIYMEHYGIEDYAVSRKENILTYYVPAKTEVERYAGYPVKATVNLLNGRETRISVTEKECHDAHEQYMLENIGRRYISRIKDFLPENERKSVESVFKAGKLAMKDFSDNDKKYISQFIKNLGATDSNSLGKALNKAVTPVSEMKKEMSLKRDEERRER